MTRGLIPELHFELLAEVVCQAHRLVISCHHGLPLSCRAVSAVALAGGAVGWSVLTVRVFLRIRLRTSQVGYLREVHFVQ